MGPLGHQVRDLMEKKCSQLKAKEKIIVRLKNILKSARSLRGVGPSKVSPDCLQILNKAQWAQWQSELDRKGEGENGLTRLENICSQVKPSLNAFLTFKSQTPHD